MESSASPASVPTPAPTEEGGGAAAPPLGSTEATSVQGTAGDPPAPTIGAAPTPPTDPPNYSLPATCPLTKLTIEPIPTSIPAVVRNKYRDSAIYFIAPANKFSRKFAKQRRLCIVSDGLVHIAQMKDGVITRSFSVRNAAEVLLSPSNAWVVGVKATLSSKDADLLVEFDGQKQRNDFLMVLMRMVASRGLQLPARMLNESGKETYRSVLKLNSQEGGKQKYAGVVRTIKEVIDLPGMGEVDKGAPPPSGAAGTPGNTQSSAPLPQEGSVGQINPPTVFESLCEQEQVQRQILITEWANGLQSAYVDFKGSPNTPHGAAQPSGPVTNNRPQEVSIPPWNDRAVAAQSADASRWDSCPNCTQLLQSLMQVSARSHMEEGGNSYSRQRDSLGDERAQYSHSPHKWRRRGHSMSSRSTRYRDEDDTDDRSSRSRSRSRRLDDDEFDDELSDDESDSLSDTDNSRSWRRSRGSRRRAHSRRSMRSPRNNGGGGGVRSPLIVSRRPLMPPVIVSSSEGGGAILLQQQIMERDEYIRLLENKVRKQRNEREDMLRDLDSKEDELDHISALIGDKERAVEQAREAVARAAAEKTDKEVESTRVVASAAVRQKELEQELDALNADYQREVVRRQQIELAILEHPRVPAEVKQLLSRYESKLQESNRRRDPSPGAWRAREWDDGGGAIDRGLDRQGYPSRARSVSNTSEADIDFLRGLLRQTVNEHKRDIREWRRQMNEYDDHIRDAVRNVASSVSPGASQQVSSASNNYSDNGNDYHRQRHYPSTRDALHEDEQYTDEFGDYARDWRGAPHRSYSHHRIFTPERRPAY